MHGIGWVLAQRALARGWIVLFTDPGQHEQSRVIEDPGCEHDCRSWLHEFFARAIHVTDACGMSVLVYDAPHLAIGANSKVFLALHEGEQCEVGARLGA